MSYYGSIILARNSASLLVHLPQMRSAFGSYWHSLEERGDGWQLLKVGVQLHEWPTVGAGPRDLAVATGSPVLASWISESSCAQLATATPDGRSWSAHLPDYGDVCGYDHHQFSPLRLPPGVHPPALDLEALITDLAAWAQEAGLSPSLSTIRAALTSHVLADETVHSVVEALGLPEKGTKVTPLFDHQELDWYWTWYRGQEAGNRVCRRWIASLRQWEQEPTMPWEADYLHFVDQVSASMYGGGLTRQELAEQAARLNETWTQEIDNERRQR